jgi:hypothetical protein
LGAAKSSGYAADKRAHMLLLISDDLDELRSKRTTTALSNF